MRTSSDVGSAAKRRASWHGTAFIIEAIVLLAFLVGAIALFMQLFSTAAAKGVENEELSHAIVLATNAAERFAADPEGVPDETADDDGCTVTCAVTPEQTEGGTLFHAKITVISEGGFAYTLETSRYVNGGVG